MKMCQQCGQACVKRPREATWQWEARKFCSHACSDLGRTTTRVENDAFRGRYRQIKVNGRKILEHRYVMEQHLGRTLLPSEHVHHINHDRLDNRVENLEVVTVEEHAERHTWRPITKACCICDATFTPDKTKRARQQTCSRECMKALIRLRWQERKARQDAA